MLHRWIKWVAIAVVAYSLVISYQNHKEEIHAALPEKTALNKTNPNDKRNVIERGFDSLMRPVVEKRIEQELQNSNVRVDNATIKSVLDQQLEKKTSIQAERKTGTGPVLTCGYTATVHYISYINGNSEVANTRRDGKAETFRIGAGAAIPGIEQGVEGMQKGGIREIVIPAELAQNSRLPAHKNGPAVTTRSVVEVMDVSPNKDFDAKALVIADKTVGSGDAVKCGQTVGIHYTPKTADGAVIAEATTPNPLYFSVGAGNVPFGLEQAVIGMRREGARSVTIPVKELGRLSTNDMMRLHGEAALPKEGNVIFDITLISITEQ